MLGDITNWCIYISETAVESEARKIMETSRSSLKSTVALINKQVALRTSTGNKSNEPEIKGLLYRQEHPTRNENHQGKVCRKEEERRPEKIRGTNAQNVMGV